LIILHLTDAHCSTSIVHRILSTHSYDLVAYTGDLECMDTAEALLKAPSNIVAVTGNMDTPSIYRRLRESGVLFDGRIGVVGGLRLAGIGGIDTSSNIATLSKAVDRIDVLLTHHPPHGILDKTLIGVNAGLYEILTVIDRLNPRIHLFGHIHENPGYMTIEGRLYVNPGPTLQGRYAIIDYENMNVKLMRIRP